MPTTTYTPLANVTLSSATSTVSFTSINGAYRDIILVMRTLTSSVGNVFLRLNNDSTTANYGYVNMGGVGSGSGLSGENNGSYAGLLTTAYVTPDATTWWDMKAEIIDSNDTTKHKGILVRNGDGVEGTQAVAGRWKSTSAVTSLVITTNSSVTFSSGSSFALYGIVA